MPDPDNRLRRAYWLAFFGVLIVVFDFTTYRTVNGDVADRVDLLHDTPGALLVLFALPAFWRAAPDTLCRCLLVLVGFQTAVSAFVGLAQLVPSLRLTLPLTVAISYAVIAVVTPLAYCFTMMRIAMAHDWPRAESTWRRLLVALAVLLILCLPLLSAAGAWMTNSIAAPGPFGLAMTMGFTLLVGALLLWGFLRGTRLSANGL